MVRKWSQARTNSTISAHHPHYALPSVRLALRVWEMWSGVSLQQVLRQGPSRQGSTLLGFESTLPGYELVRLDATTLTNRPVVRLSRLGPDLVLLPRFGDLRRVKKNHPSHARNKLAATGG